MSIPIAFAFDFQKVITLPNCGFVPGNFAKTGAAPLSGDAEFEKMQFDLIYHDSALPQEKMAEVHNWRMSEAVVSDALSLASLSYVICRTTHEERILRHALSGLAAPKIIVEQRGSIFMRRGMFIDEIYWASNLLNIQFHGPTGFHEGDIQSQGRLLGQQQPARRKFFIGPRRVPLSKHSRVERRDMENRD
jgi:hypothetical protein